MHCNRIRLAAVAMTGKRRFAGKKLGAREGPRSGHGDNASLKKSIPIAENGNDPPVGKPARHVEKRFGFRKLPRFGSTVERL